jgi:hypothetical protein
MTHVDEKAMQSSTENEKQTIQQHFYIDGLQTTHMPWLNLLFYKL